MFPNVGFNNYPAFAVNQQPGYLQGTGDPESLLFGLPTNLSATAAVNNNGAPVNNAPPQQMQSMPGGLLGMILLVLAALKAKQNNQVNTQEAAPEVKEEAPAAESENKTGSAKSEAKPEETKKTEKNEEHKQAAKSDKKKKGPIIAKATKKDKAEIKPDKTSQQANDSQEDTKLRMSLALPKELRFTQDIKPSSAIITDKQRTAIAKLQENGNYLGFVPDDNEPTVLTNKGEAHIERHAGHITKNQTVTNVYQNGIVAQITKNSESSVLGGTERYEVKLRTLDGKEETKEFSSFNPKDAKNDMSIFIANKTRADQTQFNI